MIFDSFQNHQEVDPLQKAREMPAGSFPVGMESTLADGFLLDPAAAHARPAAAESAGG